MLFYIFFVILFFPMPAHAYVDPGSGSFFLQMLAAGAVGVVFHFRRFFGRLFSRGKKPLGAEDLSDSSKHS